MPITMLDGILLGITLVSAILAMVRGFSREVLSLVSWAAAAVAAYLFFQPLLPYIKPYINNETIAKIAAAAAVFLVVLIIVSLITMKIADFIIDSRIGALDRTLGFLFGAARGVLLVVVAMLFFNWLMPDNQSAWITNAKSRPMLDSLGQQLMQLLPTNANEVIDKIKHEHAAPASNGAPGTNGANGDQDSTPAPDDNTPAQQ